MKILRDFSLIVPQSTPYFIDIDNAVVFNIVEPSFDALANVDSVHNVIPSRIGWKGIDQTSRVVANVA